MQTVGGQGMKVKIRKKFWVTIARHLKGKLTCLDSILIDNKASLKVLHKQGRKKKTLLEYKKDYFQRSNRLEVERIR